MKDTLIIILSLIGTINTYYIIHLLIKSNKQK